MKKLILAVALLLPLSGCSDAFVGKINSYGKRARITCYSGGNKIFEAVSSGKVKSEKSSDGYYFKPVGQSTSVEVSGDCIIAYLED